MKKTIMPTLRLLGYILLVAFNNFLWINFVTISPDIANYYNTSLFLIGFLAIVFPLVFIFLSIPSGILIDSRGYRMSILIGSIFMGIFSIVRILGQNYLFLLVGQIGIAIAQPFIANSVTKFANAEFSDEKVPLIIGLGSFAIFIGVAVGMILPPLLISSMGLRNLLIFITLFTVSISIYSFIVFYPLKGRVISGKKEYHFLEVLRNKNILILSYLVFVGMGAFNGILTWIDSIFAHLNFTDMESGLVGLIFVIGGMAGSIVLPGFTTRIKKRKGIVFYSLIILFVIFLIYTYFSNFEIILVLSAILGFFMLGLFPIILDWASVIAGFRLAGSATSMLWFLGQIGGFVIPLAMGIIGPISPGSSFLYSFILLAVLSLTSLFILKGVSEG